MDFILISSSSSFACLYCTFYRYQSSLPHVKPFKSLAETIGAMQAQMGSSSVKKVVLKTWGGRDVNVTNKMVRQLLEAEVLSGLIKNLKGQNLVPDLISAPAMAKEIGIESVISTENPENVGSPYWNLISVEATRADGTTSIVTGSVFGSIPHIVRVNNYVDLLSFKPEGNYILAFRNEDSPGVISEVLQVLQQANVNVASLNVTRASQGQADQKALGSRVQEVKTTTRLAGSPALITDHESGALRRMMKILDQANTGNKSSTELPPQVLEINPSHPIIVALAKAHGEGGQRTTVAELVAQQMFDNALIAAGLVEDPRSMLSRLNDILFATLSK